MVKDMLELKAREVRSLDDDDGCHCTTDALVRLTMTVHIDVLLKE